VKHTGDFYTHRNLILDVTYPAPTALYFILGRVVKEAVCTSPPSTPPVPHAPRNGDDSHTSDLRSDDMLKMSNVWNEMTF